MIERLEKQCLALLLKLVKDIVLNAMAAVNPAGASVTALSRGMLPPLALASLCGGNAEEPFWQPALRRPHHWRCTPLCVDCCFRRLYQGG